MIIVTGGAGFIGSNLVRLLNDEGHRDILVVDNLTNGHKFVNLTDLQIADYLDKEDFLALIRDEAAFARRFGRSVEVIFHEGACSETTQWDGRYMMRNNYSYSVELLGFAAARSIPFIYASSAATYGMKTGFIEERVHEGPLNVYGYSKLLFDEYVRRRLPGLSSQVVGLRYFNVYGPREGHKGSMASVAFHLNAQMLRGENPRLFRGCDGYADGMQTRDFVYVEDVCRVNYWFWREGGRSGIYNCGTGRSEPFLNVARAVIDHHHRGEVEFIDFPEHLRGHYQSFTRADLTRLRAAGCPVTFRSVAEGVGEYLRWLNSGA